MPKGFDFNERPFLVIWETTRACDLACAHCRAEAIAEPDVDELTTDEGLKLIHDVKALGAPIFIFSGGDPLKRADIYELITHAQSLGLKTGAIPAVTPSLTAEKIKKLKEARLGQIAFSLDGATAKEHDAFRGIPGIFDRTMEAIRWAGEAGLPVQINSLVNVHNTESFDALIELVEKLPIVFWELFFLIPMGRGKELPLLSAKAFEEAFKKIYQVEKKRRFIVKVTEAPHYRRFVKEKEAENTASSNGAPISHHQGVHAHIGLAPSGVNSGKGFVFVSRRGEVMPSGFLPIAVGDIRKQSLADIYRHAPLMRELRDVSLLKGKCGLCQYADLCGGSRSRAYAMTGDYLAEEPCCVYEPAMHPQPHIDA